MTRRPPWLAAMLAPVASDLCASLSRFATLATMAGWIPPARLASLVLRDLATMADTASAPLPVDSAACDSEPRQPPENPSNLRQVRA